MRRYTNEDHQRVATLPCINTILISAVFVPCAAKISARSSSCPSFTMISVLSLGVSIIHGDHTGISITRLIHSRCNLQLVLRIHFSAIHLFFPFFLSSLLRRILFRFLSFSRRFSDSRVFPFSAFPQFPTRRRASLSSYSPTLYSAALHNFYRCRETGGTYTLPHALVDSSYTYWMYACLHVDALM